MGDQVFSISTRVYPLLAVDLFYVQEHDWQRICGDLKYIAGRKDWNQYWIGFAFTCLGAALSTILSVLTGAIAKCYTPIAWFAVVLLLVLFGVSCISARREKQMNDRTISAVAEEMERIRARCLTPQPTQPNAT